MKIYTKKGDAGETSLFGGIKVPKDDLRIRTYGTFDELNAVLGVVLSQAGVSEGLRHSLIRIQGELFQLGAELATPRGRKPTLALLDEPQIEALESEIDAMEATLAPLTSFILPGGAPASSFLHMARTVARRAERELVVLNRAESVRPAVLQYVNRLSDHLFVCARKANADARIQDVAWVAPALKKA